MRPRRTMTDDTKPAPPDENGLEASTPPADASDTAIDPAAERDEYKELLLRKTAEFDNYKKRTDRERKDLVQKSSGDLIEEILPLVDDFERALAATVEGDQAAAYRNGVELIYHQLLELLRKRGVTPIDTSGAQFDPHFHQAVAHETSETHHEGEIIDELRRGYMLGTRLLRPAMVRVAKA